MVSFAGYIVSIPKLIHCHGPVIHNTERSLGISFDPAGTV